jgi:hypothetical protein
MVASAVSRGKKPVDAAVGELDEHTALEEGQFRELLEKIDRGLRALPATAQARPRALLDMPGVSGALLARARAPAPGSTDRCVFRRLLRSKRAHAQPGLG